MQRLPRFLLQRRPDSVPAVHLGLLRHLLWRPPYPCHHSDFDKRPGSRAGLWRCYRKSAAHRCGVAGANMGSCGVGSGPNGASCDSMRTTFQFGFAFFCPSSSTLPSGTTSFAIGTVCGGPRCKALTNLVAWHQCRRRTSRTLQRRYVKRIIIFTSIRTNKLKICSNRIEYYGTAVTEVHVESDVSPCDDHGHLIRQPPTHIATISTSNEHMIETTQTLHTIEPTTRISVSATPRSNKTSFSNQLGKLKKTATTRLRRLDPVKMAYLRTSFIFGFAVLITWIPSSVNRLYSIANNSHINFQLSAVSGTVLPLQGVWNALIYFTTSGKTVSHICNGTAETIFSRNSMSNMIPRSPRYRFGAAQRTRSSNIDQEDRRQGLRLDEVELPVRRPADIYRLPSQGY